MNARVYEFPSGRRLDHLHLVPPSLEPMTPETYAQLQETLKTAEAITARCRRRLGMEATKLTIDEIGDDPA